MKYARAKLNIELKSRYSSCASNSNLVIKEANSIIENIDNDSIFYIINWEINLLDFVGVTISLETKSYKNSWKELKDIKERVKNINSILFSNEETFLIDNLNFTIEPFSEEDLEKSIMGDVEKDIPQKKDDSNQAPSASMAFDRNFVFMTKEQARAYREAHLPFGEDPEKSIEEVMSDIGEKATDLPKEKLMSSFEVSPSKEERKNIVSPVGSSPGNFIPITKKQMEELLPKKEKKKSLRELILAFLKKKGPSSVKQITLGVLNMGLVTKSKSPRMLVNSMLWKLCRDERYRQKDKTGSYYNPVRLDGDRWRLSK